MELDKSWKEGITCPSHQAATIITGLWVHCQSEWQLKRGSSWGRWWGSSTAGGAAMVQSLDNLSLSLFVSRTKSQSCSVHYCWLQKRFLETVNLIGPCCVMLIKWCLIFMSTLCILIPFRSHLYITQGCNHHIHIQIRVDQYGLFQCLIKMEPLHVVLLILNILLHPCICPPWLKIIEKWIFLSEWSSTVAVLQVVCSFILPWYMNFAQVDYSYQTKIINTLLLKCIPNPYPISWNSTPASH